MKRGTAILIGIFYPLIVFLAVVLLAAVQLRSPSGSAFDTWRLNYNANRVLAEKLRQTALTLRKDSFQNIDDLSFTDICLKFFDDDGKLKPSIDPQLMSDFQAARSAGKTTEQAAGELRCLLRGFTGLQYDKHYYESKKDDFANDTADNQKAMTLNADQYTEMTKGKADFLAFKEMEDTWYSVFIAVTPYDLLVLLLVMFMGALGGMVRLLRDYGDTSRPNPPPSDYFFIPLIGLVVAIGGYVLAKTGLLLLTSSRDESSLSPFMVGLVGIVSGLLAKDVIDAIARQGRKLIQGEADGQAAEPPGNKAG